MGRATGLTLDTARMNDLPFPTGFETAMAGVERRRMVGELAFLDLVAEGGTVAEVTAAAARLARADGASPPRLDPSAPGVDPSAPVAGSRSPTLEDVVVLGIGGSALGARALRDAILGPEWNQLSVGERGGRPRLHVVDNPDGDTIGPLLRSLGPATTLFNVVSKSGSTTETLALYLAAREMVEERQGAEAVSERFVFTTSAGSGPLSAIAAREGISTLHIPPAVGGRFSVLSPVGLFPLLLAGVDVAALLAGGASMAARSLDGRLEENPAALLAVHLVHADLGSGRRVVVFMPYGDRLRECGRFFQQLWAESLGKRADRGPTPLAASGPADQHSLLQLMAQGPRDKVVVFLESKPSAEGRRPLRSDAAAGVPETARLAGRSLADIISVERRATARSLERSGCPSATIALPAADERSLGEFVMMVQMATVIAGELYGVNPFGQPAVEEVKRLVVEFLEAL